MVDLFARALERHRAGDIPSAEALYRELLQSDEGHAGAWHFLGVAHTQQGRPEQALPLIGRALELRPEDGAFHLNLGVAYQALGRIAEAEASFRRAVELGPRVAEAHNNLANLLYGRGANTEARNHWGQALSLQPQYAEAHFNLGRALLDAGEPKSAIPHLQQAVQGRPHFGEAHFSLGVALTQLQVFPAAIDHFHQALCCRVDWPEALFGLGHAWHHHKDHAKAEACLRDALRLAPSFAQAHNELGKLMVEQGRLDEAVAEFRQAVQFAPTEAEMQHDLGVALHHRRQWGPAETPLREALRLRPGFWEVYPTLMYVLEKQGRIDDAVRLGRDAIELAPGSPLLRTALGHTLGQAGEVVESILQFREAIRLRPADAMAHSCLLNALNLKPNVSSSVLFAEHRKWAEVHAPRTPLGPAADHDRALNRPLRVGYVSADFRRHVLAQFLLSILLNHDPKQVEVFAYADVAISDDLTARLRAGVPQWRSLCGASDEQAARQVQADRIDLLVDLAGHTGNRLGVFALQPAPIQVTYLGYPHTTGLKTVQYRLTDAIADPPGEPPYHTEELIRLAGGFSCYQPPLNAPEVNPLPALASGHITFGSLHKLAKINESVLDLWCEVLKAVPGSRLLLFRDILQGKTQERLRDAFVRRGVSDNRLHFEHRVSHPSFLAAYHQIDIALDTLPWNGHATACEALWMGVPTLTLLGDRHAGRMVGSVLTQVGLPEFIARTRDDYVQSAFAVANELGRLASLRAGMRERMRSSSLCNGPAFTRQLEQAYRSVWHRWLEIELPPATRWEVGPRPQYRTLLTPDRLTMIRNCCEYARSLPGDTAELGVYQGGVSKLINECSPHKLHHAFDTFTGIPEDDACPKGHRKGDFATSLAEVRAYLGENQVRYHVGFFPETARGLEGAGFSLVHVDCDIYQTVQEAIRFFVPRLVPGGVLIFDDYGWPNCPGVKRAIAEANLPVLETARWQAIHIRVQK